MATILSFWLPKVEASIYFHRKSSVEMVPMPPPEEPGAFKLLWSHFTTSYSNMEVIQWSVCYALATCGFTQVYMYMTVLWESIDNKQDVSMTTVLNFLLKPRVPVRIHAHFLLNKLYIYSVDKFFYSF